MSAVRNKGEKSAGTCAKVAHPTCHVSSSATAIADIAMRLHWELGCRRSFAATYSMSRGWLQHC